MKDFLIKCMKDLEPLTGIRQLYFLESDLQDGARKFEILIEGMLIVCNDFAYIPEDAQKKIIRDQMVKDQDYDALNSRTLYKWLNMNKDVWWEKHNRQKEEIYQEPGPLSNETLQLINNFKIDLLNSMRGNPLANQMIDDEMKKIQAEDESRISGQQMHNSDAAKHITNEHEVQRKKLHLQWIKENYDPITGKPLPTWKEESEWLSDQISSGKVSL